MGAAGVAFGAVLGGAGMLLGGAGVNRAGSGMDRAADRIAESTDKTLKSITADVNELKQHYMHEVWPYMNATLNDFRHMLLHLEEFIDISTHSMTIMTRVLTVTLLAVSAFIFQKMLSKTHYTNRLERLGLLFIYWTFLGVVAFLGMQLIGDVLVYKWLGKDAERVPYFLMIIIPSMGSMSALLGLITGIAQSVLAALVWCVGALAYVLFELPYIWIHSLESKGLRYFRNNAMALLYHAFCVLYFAVLFLLYFVFCRHLMYSEMYTFKLTPILVGYALLYTAAFVTHVFTMALISAVLRPIWAMSVRGRL